MMGEKYCPWCDKTQIRCIDPRACIMGETACSDAQAIWRLENRVAELDRLNTDLAMESHGLQAKVAELEALVWDIDYGKTPDCACRIMQPITRTEDEWIAEAKRLCPPTKVAAPLDPPMSLLMSMAIRLDHGLAVPGYYDQFPGPSHAQRLQVALSEMRAVYEEIVGEGFYKPDGSRDDYYLSMLSPDPQEDWCHAGRDGDCIWAECPQKRDGEPKATGRHCPLDAPQEDA